MYRAYWAIPRTLKTSGGEQVNTSFGVASMLLTILRIEEPTSVIVCLDEGNETFRHEEADDYKEGRAETPDDFYVQIPRVLECFDSFSFQTASHKKYEADDYLCAYARAGEDTGMQVTIVTGDRDALQLATDKTRIAIPHKGYNQAEYLGPQEIEAKYGVRPDQVVDYKGLTGDSSDNLPGVQGIGPKTAAQLLQDYDTLEGVYENLDSIRPAVKQKLERDKEQAFFCSRMAQLVCDMDLPVPLKEAKLDHLDPERLSEFFHDMEFSLLLKRLQKLVTSDYGKMVFQEGVIEEVVVQSTEKEQLPLFSE